MPRLLKRPTIGASASLGAAGALALFGGCSTEPNFGPAGGGGSTTSTTASGSPVGGGGEAATSSTSGPGDGGGGAGAVSASGPGVTSTVTSVTTGADCDAAADCLDGDPCTDDLCTDVGLCESSPRGIGLAGNPGEGACEGVCQTDGSCGAAVFSRPFGGSPGVATWETRALSELFGPGPDSPPPTGVTAVETLPIGEGMLAVFRAGDALHLRGDDLVWQVVQPASAVFPGLVGDVRASIVYQPSMDSGDFSLILSTLSEDGSGQTAFVYEIDGETLEVIPDPANPVAIDRAGEPGSPPPAGDFVRWSFSVQTAFQGSADWVIFWEQSGPNVYSLNGGDGVWTNFGDAATSPVWVAEGSPPPSDGVTAAWFDGAEIHLIVP